jgi:hypothetical protein
MATGSTFNEKREKRSEKREDRSEKIEHEPSRGVGGALASAFSFLASEFGEIA